MKLSLRPWFLRFVAAGLFLLCIQTGSAQGTFDVSPVAVLQTGSNQPLYSFEQQFTVGATAETSILQFGFGFATDEPVLPEQFLDSVSISVRDAETEQVAFLVTMDASGVIWAPVTPGGVSFPANSLQPVLMPFPQFDKTYASQTAFSVSMQLPESMRGRSLSLYFDLFDNQNLFQSMGWISSVSVVPEPGTWALLMTGILFLFGFTWHQYEKTR